MSTFNKKHYKYITRWLKENHDREVRFDSLLGRMAIAMVIGTFADELAADNSKFDRKQFVKDCGIG